MSTDQAEIPVADLIALFGGIPALARKLGIPASTVQTWALRNIVPADQVEHIRGVAAEHGIELTVEPTEKAPVTDVPVAASPIADQPASAPQSPPAPTADGPPPWHKKSDRPAVDPYQPPSWHAKSAGRPGPANPYQAPTWHKGAPLGGANRPKHQVEVPRAQAAAPPVASPKSAKQVQATDSAPAPEPVPSMSLIARIRASLNNTSAGARPITMIYIFFGLLVSASLFWTVTLNVYEGSSDEAVIAASLTPPARRRRTPAAAPAPVEPAPVEVAQADTPAATQENATISAAETGAQTITEAPEVPQEPDAVPAGQTEAEPVAVDEAEPAVADEAPEETDPVTQGATATASATVSASAGTVVGTVVEAPPSPAAITAVQFAALSENLASLQALQTEYGGALAEVGPRLDALEASLGDEMATLSRALGVSLTSARVRDALAAGADYSSEMARLTALVADDENVSGLIEALQLGSTGELASNAQILAALQALSPQIAETARLNSASGFFGRLWARLGALISVRRAGEGGIEAGVGDNDGAGALIRQALVQLAGGNIEAMLTFADRAVDGIDAGDLPAAYADWRTQAGHRADADRAAIELEGFGLDRLAQLANR